MRWISRRATCPIGKDTSNAFLSSGVYGSGVRYGG